MRLTRRQLKKIIREALEPETVAKIAKAIDLMNKKFGELEDEMEEIEDKVSSVDDKVDAVNIKAEEADEL